MEFIEAGTSTPFGVYNIKKGEGWGGVPGDLPRAPETKLALYARLRPKRGGRVAGGGARAEGRGGADLFRRAWRGLALQRTAHGTAASPALCVYPTAR